MLPDTDVVIELGGEDAKILFLTDGMEVRMNGSCAGGTGAFVDQMATLLDSTPSDMNELAKVYEIPSMLGEIEIFTKPILKTAMDCIRLIHYLDRKEKPCKESKH
jgi:activator of 2-hydroxyglutaryl-CoA dehydratase